MAVLPPMPSMSEARAMAVNPRLLARLRTPKRMSRRIIVSPCVAVADPHPERRLRALGFIHLVSLLGLGGIVIPPQPGQRFRQIQRALRNRVHPFAEAKMEIVSFQLQRIRQQNIVERPASGVALLVI